MGFHCIKKLSTKPGDVSTKLRWAATEIVEYERRKMGRSKERLNGTEPLFV
jgi:hypothetical protein